MHIVDMGRNKISADAEGLMKWLLKWKTSYCLFQELMGMRHTVSDGTICNVKKDMERPSRRVPAKRKITKVKARQNATPRHIITKVPSMITMLNSQTQPEMAAKPGVST